MPITFRLAAPNNPNDYRMVHALMREEDAEKQLVSFPTVLAFEYNDELGYEELIGFCGTHIVDDMVIAGPLLLKTDRRRVMTALRLAEFYEQTLWGLGLSSFIFSAEKGSVMEEACNRYMVNMKPYAVEGNRNFYVRKKDGQQGHSTGA